MRTAARARIPEKFLLVVVVLALCPAVPAAGNPVSEAAMDLTRQIAENYEGAEARPKVAVLELSYLDGSIDNVGRLLAEELITDLFVSGKFAIVERSRLNAILKEQQLAKEGLVTQEALKSLGNLLGARAVVTGTLTEDGGTLKVSARVISTETGVLTAVARTEIPVDSQVETLRIGKETKNQGDLAFVSNEPERLLSDTFNQGSLTGWRAFSGDWLIVDGRLAQNSPKKPAFIVAGNENWEDYTLKLRAQKIDGEEGFLIGVRAQGTRTIIWNLGGWGNRVSTVQIFPNMLVNRFQRFNVVDTPLSIKAGRWYRIEIRVKGATIQCFLDGVMLVQHTDPEYLKMGKGNIGLGTWGTRAYFDDVEVEPLN